MITDIQALLKRTVEDNGVVGAAVGFIEHKKSQFFCYGKRAIQDDELITADTIFEIGSITKVFTTLLLMDMSAKGDVKLDEPIENFLPKVKIPGLNGRKITLRDLATHHSGLPSIPGNLNPQNPMNPYADYSLEDLYSFLNGFALKKAPEEKFEYSNLGMGLLGHVLSLRARKSYGQLISDSILRKLSMNNTGVDLTSAMRDRKSIGHHLGRMVEYWDTTEAMIGAGGLRTNVKDMTQFLAANLGILNSPITDLLRQCHNRQYRASPTEDIGLGWIITPSNDADIIWHDGITGGFRTFIGFSPKTQKGIVVLSNSSDDWVNEFSFPLLHRHSLTE